MQLPATARRYVRFGPYTVDFVAREVRDGSGKVTLQDKPFQILAILLEEPGELVTREQLRERLWPADTYVDFDHSINTAIKKLREALEHNGDEARYIETLPKRGYRFIGSVEEQARWQSQPAKDAEGNESVAVTPKRHPGRSSKRWLVLTGLALAMLLGMTYLRLAPTIAAFERLRQLNRLTVAPLTALPGNVTSPTFSPDGSQVAFAWDGENNGAGFDLYVKTIGSDKPLRITHNPVNRLSAAWSPDGRYIAISKVASAGGSGIYLVPPTGGPERKLTSTPNFNRNTNVSWSPDSKMLAFTDHPENAAWERALQLFTLSLDTLERKQIKTGCTLVTLVAYAPKGDLLAWVCVDSWSRFSIHVLRQSDGRMFKLLDGVDGIGGLAWSEDGTRILYSAPLEFGDIWELSISNPGNPVRLPVGHEAADLAAGGRPGRLAYVAGIYDVNIWRIDLSGASVQSQKLIVSSREEKSPNISPDQRKIAFESNRTGGNELWTCDFDGTNAVQLTSFGIRATGTPRWAPDGQQIAFDSRVEKDANIYLINHNRGVPRKLDIRNLSGNNQPSWSKDGNWIYFVHGEDEHNPGVWKVSSSGGDAVEIAPSPATYPLESPDGNWLFFVRRDRLWRSRTNGFAAEEVRGMPPLKLLGDKWVPFGSGIFYLADVNQKTELDFFDLKSRVSKKIWVLERTPPFWMGQMSVSADGRWLVFPQIDEQSSNLMMIENWE